MSNNKTLNNQSQLHMENTMADQKAINAVLANYATKFIDISNLNDDDKKRKEEELGEAAKILATSLGAQGLLQHMLVSQLLGVHELQQKTLSYANKSIHSPEHGQYYMNAITKLSNVFIQQVSLLQKMQGKNQQKVIVEHLHVNEGGQAMVGQVTLSAGGAIVENKNNAMQAEQINYPFQKSVRCGAKTRRGTSCQSPAVSGKRRCRMHGGNNNGAPRGNSNALKNGFTTQEVKKLRKMIKALLNEKIQY